MFALRIMHSGSRRSNAMQRDLVARCMRRSSNNCQVEVRRVLRLSRDLYRIRRGGQATVSFCGMVDVISAEHE